MMAAALLGLGLLFAGAGFFVAWQALAFTMRDPTLPQAPAGERRSGPTRTPVPNAGEERSE